MYLDALYYTNILYAILQYSSVDDMSLIPPSPFDNFFEFLIPLPNGFSVEHVVKYCTKNRARNPDWR
jgi:hypothetical protein